MSYLDIYHEMSCGENIIVEDYNNNVIFNELVNPDKGLYMLTGKGKFKGSDKQIAISSCYISEGSNFSMVGFNRYAKNINKCYQKIRLSNPVAGTTYRLNILTTQMTEYDFKVPGEEVKRIAINVTNKVQNQTQLQQLRDNHVAAWFNMWKSNISIDPKIGITTNEATDLNNIKRILRYSLYNIWSSVREGIRTEVNPASLSVFDSYGTLYWDGDLWFIPVVTMFRPDIAKNILEARARVLDKAVQLAQGYGYGGSKFPYVNDVTGYINAPYWDVNGPMHIFNTALISISIWNYYRISQDKDWMTNKGYNIMKNNADFFVSKTDIDDDGSYHIRNVYSFHDKISNDNALTTYLIKTAMKYTIEASYELNIVPKETWGRVYFKIDTSFFDDNPLGIIKMDDQSQNTDSYKFLEMLIPLSPYYNDTWYKTNLSRTYTSIATNVDFYKTKLSSPYDTNPMNNLIIAWLQGSMTNNDSSYPQTFATSLKKIYTDNVVGIWGQFNMDNKTTDYNDISLSSLFVLMMLTTMGTLKISGSVSETRFYSESMGIRYASTASMPNTWKNVKVTGVGARGDTYSILNQVYYT
jgi:trehalose/maltose hydrolase-like predicted phosphorylase